MRILVYQLIGNVIICFGCSNSWGLNIYWFYHGLALYADILPLAITCGKLFGIKSQPMVRSIYSLTCLTGHLCLTVTLRPAQLILLYNLTLFNGHLSNTANSHLFHAWIVISSSNKDHFGHLITWHNVYDRSRDMVTFKIINNRRREIQLIELVI